MTKKNKKNRKWIGILSGVCIFIFAIVILGWNTPVANINIVGNIYGTEEEIENQLFPTNREKSYFSCLIGQVFGVKHTIPSIQQVQLKFKSFDTVEANVYEKGIVGCIFYMGQYLYFDKDGIVIDSSMEQLDGVPIIEGIKFNKVVMYERIGTESEDIFVNILNLTQILHKNNIKMDKAYFSKDLKATLYYGNIEILLGFNDFMEDKIAVIASIIRNNGFDGLEGTLDLQNYSDTNNEYLFKKKEEK